MILLASTVKHHSSDKIIMALVLERKHWRFPRYIYIYIWQILAGSIFKYFPSYMATDATKPLSTIFFNIWPMMEESRFRVLCFTYYLIFNQSKFHVHCFIYMANIRRKFLELSLSCLVITRFLVHSLLGHRLFPYVCLDDGFIFCVSDCLPVILLILDTIAKNLFALSLKRYNSQKN